MRWPMAYAVFLALCLPIGVQSQEYPNHPIRVIVPNAAGGGTDTFARVISTRLAEAWGQPVVVENRSGAQGNIGTALGAKAPADGYTITVAYVGALAINPFLYADVGFDTMKDFVPVSLGVQQSYLVVVNPSVPANSLKELETLAKSRPNRLSYASTSAQTQLIGALFRMLSGAEMLYVPYRAAATAVVDLMSGQVDVMFASLPSTIPLVNQGRLKALAVTGNQRTAALPNTPTAKEAGYPDFEVTGWYGFVVPAGTPREIVAKLNAQINRLLETKGVRDSLIAAGFEPRGGSPEEFGALIRRDHERWGKVVKISGVKVQ